MLYRAKILPILALFFLSGCGGANMPLSNSPAMHKATMRPYIVGGKRYYPTIVNVGDSASGIASWYGPQFHGKKTSNGEIYNMHSMTAAHKTLPMNTILRVTNLNNGRQTIVRINDRGPFVNNRIIDLSKSAAAQIDMLKKGTAPVRLEVLGFAGKNSGSNLNAAIKNSHFKRSVEGGNFMVQIGAFRNLEGAKTYQRNYHQSSGYSVAIRRYIIDEKPIFRVFLTGFRSEDEARDYAHSGQIRGAFIVRE